MNRREALRHFGHAAGALLIWRSLPIPSWAALPEIEGWKESDVARLTAIGDTILPATPGSPGAGAIHIGRFVAMMLAECHPAVDSDDVRSFLSEFERHIGLNDGARFDQIGAEEREKRLVEFERRVKAAPAETGWANGFKVVKRLVLTGYFTSEPGATQALRYDPVPGAYHGSVPADATTKAWAT